MTNIAICVRLTETELAPFEAEAIKMGLSRSSAVRAAIRLWISTPVDQRGIELTDRIDSRSRRGREKAFQDAVAQAVAEELNRRMGSAAVPSVEGQEHLKPA